VITSDIWGNVYAFSVWNRTVWKIVPSVITFDKGGFQKLATLPAGNDTWWASIPWAVYPGFSADAYGNIFVSGLSVVYQIDPSGNVTTLAGGNTSQIEPFELGDGGPALQAVLESQRELQLIPPAMCMWPVVGNCYPTRTTIPNISTDI
jgi:hypothetical protein